MTDDPLIKVTVFMRASLLLKLRDRAAQVAGSSVSRLCRDGALRELAEALPIAVLVPADAPG